MTMTLDQKMLQDVLEELRIARDQIHKMRNENIRLRDAIATTLKENGHLSDGENCTLIILKRAIEYENGNAV